MKNKIFAIPIITSVVLFFILSIVPFKSFWGYNHLAFLNDTMTYLVYVLLGICLVLLFVKLPLSLLENIIIQFNKHLFGKDNKYRIIFSICLGFLFYIFKSENHLLGDGYALIANIGQGKYYIHKWTETGSIYLIRFLQQLFGGYTNDTAVNVFQLLSISSGIIFVYNLFVIFSSLTKNAYWRVFGFGTLLFSGYLLLFFGYVEYYPITLALLTTYISFSLLNIQNEKYLLLATLFFGLSFASHVISIIFLPGLLYLYYLKINSNQIRKVIFILSLAIIPVGICIYYWLYNNSLAFEILNLPLINGRPIAPNYTVFSVEHFKDIFNLLFLVLPGSLVILLLSFKVRFSHYKSEIANFLLLSSIGSIIFLMLFGAAITMGRDWDIMSFTLLFPILLILYLIFKTNILNNYRHLFAYLFLIFALSFSFISVSTADESAEKRFYTLLNSHNRNMWMVFGQYYLEKGEKEKYLKIAKESLQVYPDYVQYKIAYNLLKKNNSARAFKITAKLVENNPYEPDFLQLAAFMHHAKNDNDKAEELYKKALQLKPYSAVIRNDLSLIYLAQNRNDDAIAILDEARKFTSDQALLLESLAKVYIKKNDYTTAGFFADSLMMQNHNGASHLINMNIMIQTNQPNEAIKYYKLFKRDGKDRPDYQRIVEHYEKFLKE